MGIKICNLCCGHGHVFEGWFRSDEELEADLKEGRIECPVCGDPRVAERPRAPNFVRVQGTTRTAVAADVAARGCHSRLARRPSSLAFMIGVPVWTL